MQEPSRSGAVECKTETQLMQYALDKADTDTAEACAGPSRKRSRQHDHDLHAHTAQGNSTDDEPVQTTHTSSRRRRGSAAATEAVALDGEPGVPAFKSSDAEAVAVDGEHDVATFQSNDGVAQGTGWAVDEQEVDSDDDFDPQLPGSQSRQEAQHVNLKAAMPVTGHQFGCGHVQLPAEKTHAHLWNVCAVAVGVL